MKRGDVVLVRYQSSPASKPRPCIVVQRSSALDDPSKITVCPLTSVLKGTAGQRPFVAPTADNQLTRPSEIQVDWVFTLPASQIGEIIGKLDRPTLGQVDEALRRWLDL